MRTPQRIAMIGYGAVSQAVLRHFAAYGIEALCVLLRPGRKDTKRAEPPRPLRFVDDVNEMLSLKPDLVIECAGQGAVAQYAEKVVSAGADLMTISMGAFADAALLDRVKAAAQKTGAQILIPAGAVGALDLLAAVRNEGIERVVLRSIKPPLAWLGTAGEKAVDLAAVREAVCLFKGNAREAASTYPMNANVAAAVALAGVGFERTAVELVADPHAGGNRNEILAEGAFGRFEIRMLGKTRPEAPRTSISAPLSILRGVLNRGAGIVV
ncbi:MAG: aspartate dehydrogenase [Burkholderiales bacterium]